MLAVLVLLVGCAEDPEPSDASVDPRICMPPIDTEVAPQPMGTPPVWVDRGVPFERPAGTEFRTHLWLPQHYNRASVYPIVEGDSAHVRFRFMVGLEYDPISIRTFIFVEGRPVEVVVDGERVSRVDDEGQVEHIAVVQLRCDGMQLCVEAPSEVFEDDAALRRLIAGRAGEGFTVRAGMGCSVAKFREKSQRWRL